MIDMNRRSLLIGGLALFAAPAIVRATSIMPVKAWRVPIGRNIYVRETATGLGNGTSWADAFTNVADVLSNIDEADSVFIDGTHIRSEGVLVFPKAKQFVLSNCKIQPNFGGTIKFG